VTVAGSLALPAGHVFAASAGCSAGGTCVAVHQWINGTDTVVRKLTASDLTDEADVAPGNNAICYEARATVGKASSCHNVSHALSIHALLAGTSDGEPNAGGKSLADTATFTEVPRPSDGSMSTLSPRKELAADTTGVFSGGLLPVIHTLGGSAGPVEYVRPLTPDSQDTNARDIFSTADADIPLNVYVFTGDMLTVSLSANQTKVKSGQPVTFTGSATDGSTPVDADSLDYSWSFSDGTHPTITTTPRVTHTFPNGSGVYFVQLTATGKTDGSGGASEPVQITVGTVPSPSPSASPKPGPITTSPPPTASPTPGPITTSTPHPGADSSPHPGKGKDPKGPKIPALGLGTVPGSIASRLNGLLQGQQPQLANPADGLPIVSGQVIGGGQPLSLREAASQASTLGSAPADDATTRWSPGVVPIYVAVVVFLLGLGIGRERGWRRFLRR
jgi:PKD domain